MRTRFLLILSLAAAPALSSVLEVTLAFPGRPIESIEGRGETEYLGPDSLLILGGAKISWEDGEILDVRGLPVLLDRKAKHLRFLSESDSLHVYYGTVSGLPLEGSFKLTRPFRLTGPGILVKLEGGRYMLKDGRLDLFLRGSSWRRSARGFIVAAFIGLVTLILLMNARRTRRRLLDARPPSGRPR